MADSSQSVNAPVATPEKQQWFASHSEDTKRIYKLLVSGGLAGAISRSITAPIDRLKMILQVQDDARGMTLRQGMDKIASEGSIRSYFRGNGANVIKIAPETGMKLTLNDRFKVIVAQDPDNIQPSERMVAGGLAGALAQFLLYPLDVIRTRLAVAPKGTYNGIADAATCMWVREGPLSLYSGLLPCMIGILPYAGVDIAIFEMAREHLMDEYEGNPPHFAILGVGMVSSSVAQIVSYPLSLIRTRLQAQINLLPAVAYMDTLQAQRLAKGPLKYSGMIDVIVKLEAAAAAAAGISWYVFEETKVYLGVDLYQASSE
eukprot:gene31986-33912_t